MFIISNNCFGGMCYKLTNTTYNNPFMFTIKKYTDMANLLCNKINFANIKIVETELPVIRGRGFDIIIDGLIRLYFRHQIWDMQYDTPTKIGVNIHYKYIYEYIVEKYLERCKRMCTLNEDMRLCISSDKDSGSIRDMLKLIELCKYHNVKYCVIIKDIDAPACDIDMHYIVSPNCREWVLTTANVQYKNILSKLGY